MRMFNQSKNYLKIPKSDESYFGKNFKHINEFSFFQNLIWQYCSLGIYLFEFFSEVYFLTFRTFLLIKKKLFKSFIQQKNLK